LRRLSRAVQTLGIARQGAYATPPFRSYYPRGECVPVTIQAAVVSNVIAAPRRKGILQAVLDAVFVGIIIRDDNTSSVLSGREERERERERERGGRGWGALRVFIRRI